MAKPSAALAKRQTRQTAISLLGGISLWFLFLNTANALASLSCALSWLSVRVAGLSGLQLVEALVALITLLLLLALVYLPWRQWRTYQTDTPAENSRLLEDTEKDRRALMAFVTMLLNSLFCLSVIATFVPLFVLNVCAQG